MFELTAAGAIQIITFEVAPVHQAYAECDIDVLYQAIVKFLAISWRLIILRHIISRCGPLRYRPVIFARHFDIRAAILAGTVLRREQYLINQLQ